MHRAVSAGLAAAALALAGCADEEVILVGERLDVRAQTSLGVAPPADPDAPPVDRAFAAPPQQSLAEWTHVAGGPTHRTEHAAMRSLPERIWSTGIGSGNSRKHRITSSPVVADGRIFTLDSRARVAATSTGGAPIWARDLTPESDREGDASGGGVAVADGKLFVTTGFGELAALDPATGAEIWSQKLDAPATSSPTVVGGLVYIVSRDNVAWAIDTDDGRVRWQLPGTPSVSGVVGGAAPAVTESVAIFPFGSGELVAALRQGGVRLWGAAVSGARRGRPYANITDIAADPVVAGDVIYTANHSGRAVAMSLNSGARLWTANHGAYGPVWVAGGSVFLVSDAAELVRLDAETGQQIWARELPYFKRDRGRRRKAIYAYFGPVLAGGRLWLASDTGELVAHNPETGDPQATLDIPGGAASTMAFAGGTMYVISRNGQLHAYR
ncbi:MAG: PQQ-binding-like beta-propeller repeat protein [Rhodobacter sp.]|nr:PQQ-binding-like beta-propeller repeat protein [Rhodobacter sp.]